MLTQQAYNAFVSSCVDFVGSWNNGTAALNTMRLFTDAWSSPAVRKNCNNPLFVLDSFAVKGTGESILNFAQPGWDL